MLGSVAEAEDVVQKGLLRVHQAFDAGARSRVTGGEGACGWARRRTAPHARAANVGGGSDAD
jgi:hypothetical protein